MSMSHTVIRYVGGAEDARYPAADLDQAHEMVEEYEIFDADYQSAQRHGAEISYRIVPDTV